MDRPIEQWLLDATFANGALHMFTTRGDIERPTTLTKVYVTSKKPLVWYGYDFCLQFTGETLNERTDARDAINEVTYTRINLATSSGRTTWGRMLTNRKGKYDDLCEAKSWFANVKDGAEPPSGVMTPEVCAILSFHAMHMHRVIMDYIALYNL